MLGRLGIFLAGMVVAFLLDPANGGKRRAELARRLAPLRRRLEAATEGDTEGAGMPAPVTEMVRNASAVVDRVQDRIDTISRQVQDRIDSGPSEAAGTVADAVKQAAQSAKERAQPVQDQAAAAVQQTTQLVHERAQEVAQQAAGAAPDQAAAEGDAARQAGQAGQGDQASQRTQRNQAGPQAQRGRAARSTQADATSVAPEDVAPTSQFDPIPEGDPDVAHPGETINDPTLVARIESELYRDGAIPKGELNIDAIHGVVTLRGTVKGEVADEVVQRTLGIEGVRDIVDLLQRD